MRGLTSCQIQVQTLLSRTRRTFSMPVRIKSTSTVFLPFLCYWLTTDRMGKTHLKVDNPNQEEKKADNHQGHY